MNIKYITSPIPRILNGGGYPNLNKHREEVISLWNL